MSIDYQKNEREIILVKPHSMALMSHVILTLLLSLLWLPVLIVKIVQRCKTRYILTNRRIILEGGVLSKFSKESPLNKIQNVSVFQSLIGRLFNYGSVILQTASELGITVFKYIPDPQNFRSKIINEIEIFNEEDINKRAKAWTGAMRENMDNKNKIEFENEKKCPQCAEIVKKAAKICRFCNYDFE